MINNDQGMIRHTQLQDTIRFPIWYACMTSIGTGDPFCPDMSTGEEYQKSKLPSCFIFNTSIYKYV